MATQCVGRSSNAKNIGRRSLRKRRESEEENVYIDLNRDHTGLVQEILFYVVKPDVSKPKKLAYLNGFVKLLQSLNSCDMIQYSYKDIFCCLRVSLFHEACEVRAAGLRACRYLIQNVEAAEAFCQMKLHFLAARSLDILLDNRLERIHALRLMRKFLCINPFGFPSSFTNCIIAIVNEGAQERDLVKACLATLAQLTLLNPEACTSANGISVLLLNIIDCQQPQIVEAVLGVILFLFNDPKTRRVLKSDLGLEHFLAPYTDCHYQYPSEIGDGSVNEDREAKLAATKLAVVSLLRSWSGITYLFRTDHREISSLIEMLYLPYSNMQKNIIDLMFEIFDLPVPEWTDDFSVAMLSANPSAVQSSWQLFEGYVVAEGTSVLPYISKNRTNLMDNYFALLLLLFMQEGLLEALAEVIVSAEISLAVRCTVLLGELLHMCNQYLPSDCCHPCNCLPSLILTAASFKSPQQQNQASASLTCLFRIHEFKKRGCVANSLVLTNLLHICNPEREKKSFFSATISKAKLYQFIKKDMSEIINQVLKDTLVLSDEHDCWDWDLIDCILKNPVDALKKAEDANCRSFVQRLLHYFKPSSKQFSEVKCDDERAPQIIVTSNHFMEYLLEMDEARSQEFLDDFLDDLNNSLLEVTTDTVPLDVVLSPSNILSTLSHAFFLLIGKLSSSHKGCKFLDRCGTFQILFRLVSIANLDTYIKLVVSTLDFSKEGFSRTVLSKVLTGTNESARLYATNYLRVLLRAGLPNFRKWAIEFLVTQLYDPCSAVSYAAVDILDEACNIKENLETLVSLRPSPLHLGDKGLLLLLRFLSIPSGFHFLRDAKFLDNEIDRWNKIYNLKYVKIIEDLLNEALTRHRRGEDGTYGRRSSDTKLAVNSVFVPHHMYGQLVQHKEGLDVLLNKICLSDVFSSISSPDFSSESQLLHLKAALWAVGHLGSYPLGLPIVIEHGILSQIVQLAAEAPVLSIRGTCFFVLGLLSSTPEGAQSLSEYGWEAVCHNHEKIRLITKNCSSDVLPSRRKWSLNSNECEWPLGGLPYSLSFVVQNDNRNLSASQSSHSLDVDDVKKSNTSSFSSTASVQLPNNKYEICARPRSSSDCQPSWKGAPELLKVEASSWDSLSLKNRKEIVFKERSISSYEMESHASLDTNISRTNSNESGQSGLTDTSVSETNLFDNVLCNNRTFSSQQLKASLNTIPSCNSGNNSLQSSDENDRHPSILRHLSRGHSCYLHSSPVSEDSHVFTFTSVRDAQGYATLKNIQRKRVQSLCIQDSSSYDIADDFANCKFSSVPLSTSPYTTGAQRNISFSQSNTSLKSQQSNQDSELFDKNDHNSSDENNMQYIGLCLPSHSKLIFSVPTETMQSFEADVLASDDENLGLEFHTICNCLASHSSHGKTGLLQMTIDEEVEETVAVVEENINKENNIKMKGINKRPDSRPKVTTKIIEDTAERKTLVRKEIVRFVTNLSSSVAVKAAEQGLLSLKQKFPAAFQDVCLYSEICLQMAKYSFRLPARRFLQELFLDISFEQLQWEAETIVGVLNLPHKGGSDA